MRSRRDPYSIEEFKPVKRKHVVKGEVLIVTLHYLKSPLDPDFVRSETVTQEKEKGISLLLRTKKTCNSRYDEKLRISVSS